VLSGQKKITLMNKILINASNINKGGGIQVASSIINNLRFTENNYLIVCSKEIALNLKSTNIKVIVYNKKINLRSLLFFYDKTLNNIENKFNPDFILSIFGPIYWRSKTKNLVGYAKPQYVYPNSPYFKSLSIKDKFLISIKKIIHLRDFRLNADLLWTETLDVKKRLEKLFDKEIIVGGNFISPLIKKVEHKKPDISRKKINILYLTSNYPHKNIKILDKVSEILDQKGIKHNFTITIPPLPFKNKKNFSFIGNVKLSEIGELYSNCDCTISTSLLECFSANYIESMYFKKLLFVSDLSFAHTICGNSAVYFDPISAIDIAEKIHYYFNNKLKSELISNGQLLLPKYINSNDRNKILIDKIISLI